LVFFLSSPLADIFFIYALTHGVETFLFHLLLDLQQLRFNAPDLLHIEIVSKFFSLLQGQPIGLEEHVIMSFQIFDHAIQLAKHASVLFDEEVQSFSITGPQLISWLKNSLALFEHPTAPIKVVSFDCKTSY